MRGREAAVIDSTPMRLGEIGTTITSIATSTVIRARRVDTDGVWCAAAAVIAALVNIDAYFAIFDSVSDIRKSVFGAIANVGSFPASFARARIQI